jgi:hypothetical protein
MRDSIWGHGARVLHAAVADACRPLSRTRAARSTQALVLGFGIILETIWSSFTAQI